MDKVFIAGGTGMLGAAAAQAFANEGVQVVVSSRKEKDPTGERLETSSDLIQLERVDLLDGEAVAAIYAKHKFDGVVFLAQTHQLARSRDTVNQIYPILINCLEYARKAGVKRFVFGSSLAIYGGAEPSMNEQTKFSMRVNGSGMIVKYEIAVKRATEIIALDYGQEFQFGLSVLPGDKPSSKHELEVVALRSSMMFGPGYYAMGSPLGVGAHVAAGRLPTFKGHLGYGGVPVERLWAATAPIPASYVKDNADCIKTAMLADTLKNYIYNICSGFPCNARAQFDALLSAVPDCADRMGITRDEIRDKTYDRGFNGDLFAQDFGWKSSYSLESALVDYIEWLKDHPL